MKLLKSYETGYIRRVSPNMFWTKELAKHYRCEALSDGTISFKGPENSDHLISPDDVAKGVIRPSLWRLF